MMKKWLSILALGVGLLASTAGANAQTVDASKAQPGTAPAVTKVESVDILKQNQAERSRDQPGNNAPTWRIVNEGQKNYSSLPGAETGVLIQPKMRFPGQARATTAGEAWRQYRNGPLTQIGGWLLLIGAAAIGALYFLKGPILLSAPRTGRLIERFTSIERVVHWSAAISFVALAASGLIMLFGKFVLMPVIGHTLFGWLTYVLKNVHNFVGPVFAMSVIAFFVIYVKDNFPAREDIKWLANLGGLFSSTHTSAGRFNAGEKVWFWLGVVVFGLLASASGLVLNMVVPGIETTRGNMQIANVIHIISTVLLASMAMAHIYLGTIGTEGAYEGMRTGYVDDTWAKEHHDLWYQQVIKGEVPRVRTQERQGESAAPAKAV
jgi:formate dehydrogenase subunit gamma